MKSNTFCKAAISSLLVATTMVGCSGAAFKSRPSAAAGQQGQIVAKQDKDAAKLAATAEKALASRDFDAALKAAEAAVAAKPDNGAYRQILGRAYAAKGRFASADTALSDAMTLGNTDARTVITLALVQSALGKGEQARAMLAERVTDLPAADYGLAMAMAGDATEGVRILSLAIHDPASDARTRQNLAYAYALAGRWKDARMMAGEDLAPLAAAQRVSQWAQMADPAMAPQRVATLMGVTLDAGDPGLPTALALNAAPAAPEVQMADAAATPVDGPVEVAAAEPAPEPTAAPAFAESVPVIQAIPTPVRTAANEPAPAKKARAAKVAIAAPAAAAPAATMQKVAFLKPVNGANSWVVQLGAFDTAAIAKEKWTRMATGNDMLAAFPVITSQATVKGKPFHRLAISGFGTRADALAMCKSIQSQRGQCFVREAAPGGVQQHWAVAGKGRQFASR